MKGHSGELPPTISEVADYLLLRPHSAVELVHRAVAAGLVRRRRDPRDGRVTRLELTEEGDRLVTDLTHAHLAELHKLAAVLNRLVVGDYLGSGGLPGTTSGPATGSHQPLTQYPGRAAFVPVPRRTTLKYRVTI